MVDYREILRLDSLRYNHSEIASAVKSSRGTVSDVLNRAKLKGIAWPLDKSLTDRGLYETLYPERLEKAVVWMKPDCEYIHSELSRKGVNLTLLHKEYTARCSTEGGVPYKYS